MNQGRIWTVVNPTVGLPLFLGAVATTSLIVHASILTHTTWYPAFMQGATKGKVAEAAPAVVPATSLARVPGAQGTQLVLDKVTLDQLSSGSREATIVFPDGRTAKVVLDVPATQASAPRVVTGATEPRVQSVAAIDTKPGSGK